MVKYWQPNFNNVKVISAHDHAIRDLAFSPTDSKFVTASDDSTLKIFDFAGGVEESTLTGHGWDAKTVDWHPTKGLLVSGSKDHQVKLWDPRTGRCLTTLHGHKTSVCKASFEPIRGQLLATCARDNIARVFDLRMMRDICFLRGHEKSIMTLVWHPIHVSMLTTGGEDGSIFHYLLDEPNPPPGSASTVSPYDSPDPANAPAQTIYPAHRIPHAHDSTIWSLDWHPLGHILASGSNDRATRFWVRPRPGDADCFEDRYHIGEAAAEARGTWSQARRKQMRDEEQQEVDDEAGGLVDQKMPAKQPAMPGLPGITAIGDGSSTGGAQIQIPGMSTVPPPPLPPAPTGFPAILGMDPNAAPDLTKLAQMFGGQLPPPPIPPPNVTSAPGSIPPPPPGFGVFPNGLPSPHLLPPGFPPPLGFPIPNVAGAIPGFGTDGSSGGGNVRKRAPLPSQQETLQEEMRKGKYQRPR